MIAIFKRPFKSALFQSPLACFFLGMLFCGVMISSVSDTGLIRKAHAITVSVAVKLLDKSIVDSEARIIEELTKVCTPAEEEG